MKIQGETVIYGKIKPGKQEKKNQKKKRKGGVRLKKKQLTFGNVLDFTRRRVKEEPFCYLLLLLLVQLCFFFVSHVSLSLSVSQCLSEFFFFLMNQCLSDLNENEHGINITHSGREGENRGNNPLRQTTKSELFVTVQFGTRRDGRTRLV